MSSPTTQQNRPLAVETPLGKDAFLLEKITGTEELSALFQFDLDLLVELTADVPFEKVLGQKMTARITLKNGTDRYVSGICGRLRRAGAVYGKDKKPIYVRYQARLVPELWLLTKQVRSRVFLNSSVEEILKIVLKGLDVSFTYPFGPFKTRDFCVQYRESDFAFASRLLEEEGIYYYFDHGKNGCQLVLSDQKAYPLLPAPHETITFDDVTGTQQIDVITQWQKDQELAPSSFVVRDYHFQLPDQDLEASEPLAAGVGNPKAPLTGSPQLEMYDHTGLYANSFDLIDRGGAEKPERLQGVFAESERIVKLRMEEELARCARWEGVSTCAALVPGYQFALAQHPQDKGAFLVTRVEHEAADVNVRSGGQESFHYTNRFYCLPADRMYRPARTTPRPSVHGTLPAVVTGNTPGEVNTDKFGRVMVRFPWDRETNDSDPNRSFWIRVSQPWAGKGWGQLHLPRVGDEVIVGFTDGNPDLPVILGSLYNYNQTPPYDLPKEAVMSGIKTRSVATADPQQASELRFDDTPNQEKVVLHAQKNLDTSVENNATHDVGKDQTTTVGNNATTSISGSQTVSVGDDPATMNVTNTWNNIEINKLTKSVVSPAHGEADGVLLDVHGVRGTLVPLLDVEIVGKKIEVSASKTEFVGGNKNKRIKGDTFTVIEGEKYEQVTKDSDLVAENIRLSAEEKVGILGEKTVIINGTDAVEIYSSGVDIKFGKGKVDITATAITITGNEIVLNGKILLKGQVDVQLPPLPPPPPPLPPSVEELEARLKGLQEYGRVLQLMQDMAD